MSRMGATLQGAVFDKQRERLGIGRATIGHAKLKVCVYGAPGSGKTYTCLLIATEIYKREGGRILLLDTERGSDLYAERFDFDVLHTRSIADAADALEADGYSVIIFDSITHLWEGAQEAYLAKLAASDKPQTRQRGLAGDLQFQDWRHIKRPYRQFIHKLLNCDRHVFLCGRLSDVYEREAGELKKVGERVNAEKDTAYETHVTIRMALESSRNGQAHVAYVEKDRSGLIDGKRMETPDFGVLEPIYAKIAGHIQEDVPDTDEAARADSRLFTEIDEAEREDGSAERQIDAGNGGEERRKVMRLAFDRLRSAILKHEKVTKKKATTLAEIETLTALGFKGIEDIALKDAIERASEQGILDALDAMSKRAVELLRGENGAANGNNGAPEPQAAINGETLCAAKRKRILDWIGGNIQRQAAFRELVGDDQAEITDEYLKPLGLDLLQDTLDKLGVK